MTDKLTIANEKKDITATVMKEQLTLLGITVESDKKDEIWKIYDENRGKLIMYQTLQDMKSKCLTKAFGDHGSSKLCQKCKDTQPDVYKACAEAAAAKKKVVAEKRAKDNRRMGHRTGDRLWGTRPNTMAKKFCEAILVAGENGITMTGARKAKWNPKGYAFNETANRLVKEGLVELREGRYYVTQLGLENTEAPEVANG